MKCYEQFVIVLSLNISITVCSVWILHGLFKVLYVGATLENWKLQLIQNTVTGIIMSISYLFHVAPLLCTVLAFGCVIQNEICHFVACKTYLFPPPMPFWIPCTLPPLLPHPQLTFANFFAAAAYLPPPPHLCFLAICTRYRGLAKGQLLQSSVPQ